MYKLIVAQKLEIQLANSAVFWGILKMVRWDRTLPAEIKNQRNSSTNTTNSTNR